MQGYLGILLSSFALQAKHFQGQSAHVDLRARGKPALKQAPKHTCVDLLAPPTVSVGQPGAPAQTWASEEGADWSGTCIPTAGAAGPPPSMFCLVPNGSLYPLPLAVGSCLQLHMDAVGTYGMVPSL